MATLRDIRDELYRKLSPVAAEWKVFGVQLRLEQAELNKLEVTSNKKPQACFNEMMKYWMENDGPHRWEEIFDALKQIHQSGLARKLSSDFAAEAQVTMDLVDLTRKLSTVEHCWSLFGTSLGIDRYMLKSIEGRKSTEEYLHDVIDMWCDKYHDIGLDQLQEIFTALENIYKRVLARELKEYFTGRNQPPRRSVATDDNTDNITINEEDELSRRLECVNINNGQQYSHPSPQYSCPVQVTREGNTETSAFSRTSEIYMESREETQ